MFLRKAGAPANETRERRVEHHWSKFIAIIGLREGFRLLQLLFVLGRVYRRERSPGDHHGGQGQSHSFPGVRKVHKFLLSISEFKFVILLSWA